MKKHKKILGVVFLLVAYFTFWSFIDVYAAPANNGKNCVAIDDNKNYYGPNIEFDLQNYQVKITVKKGSFKVADIVKDKPNDTSVTAAGLGILTPENPLYIKYNYTDATNGDNISVKFQMAQTDNRCYSYDEAPVNKNGEKANTYTFSTDFTIVNANSNYNYTEANNKYGTICKVVNGSLEDAMSYFAKYQDNFSVSKQDIIDYTRSNEAQNHLKKIFVYCYTPGKVQFNYTNEQVGKALSAAIKSWKAKSTVNSTPISQSFMEAFNNIRNQAQNTPGHVVTYTDSLKGRIGDTLTCDWRLDKTDSDYYANKQYYYASQTTSQSVQYKYKYYDSYNDGKYKIVSVNNVCSKTCEEAVKVEYGPPVASKAGLCFEYKVKVTSYVKCEGKSNIEPPTPPTVCTPVPYCNDIPGYTTQAGPKEGFDSCVYKCDGGKYSESCSNKCYKKLYGTSKKSSKIALEYGTYVMPSKMTLSSDYFAGKYDFDGRGIVWKGQNTYGRWYYENQLDRTSADDVSENGSYVPIEGFKNHHGSCLDPCTWNNCGTEEYLNSEDAQSDYIDNLGAYNDAISECEAQASCNTTTAEFRISVDYNTKDKNNNVTTSTTEFPYSTKVDKINTVSQPAKDKDGNVIDNESIILDYAGCYGDTKGEHKYMTEWSFPGTWINNKTGEISYKKPGTDSGWHQAIDKFCTPLNALSINTKWWEWNQLDNKNCYTADEIQKDIKNNIHASTKNFGYFGWNFDISCFYALKNEECEISDTGCCNPDPEGGKTSTVNNYNFRNVDLTELFPATTNVTGTNAKSVGDATLRKLANKDTTSSNTGRTPGYNWSSAAINMNNEKYIVNPDTLITDIQDVGNSIYNETYAQGNNQSTDYKYLDYYFVLDKQTLAKIRRYNANSNSNYSSFGIGVNGEVDSGAIKTKNGLHVYSSKFLRESGLFDKYVFGTIGENNE